MTHRGHLKHPEGDTDELTPPPLPTYTALRFVRGAHTGSNIRCGLLMPSQPSLALGSLLSLDSWEASAVGRRPSPTHRQLAAPSSSDPGDRGRMPAGSDCLAGLEPPNTLRYPLVPGGPSASSSCLEGRREEAAEDKQDQQRSDSAQGEPTAREPSPVPGLQKPGQGIHTPTHTGSQGSQWQGQLLSPTLVAGPGQVSPPGLC